ncbi:unnamed protein product [Caretta caretta]
MTHPSIHNFTLPCSGSPHCSSIKEEGTKVVVVMQTLVSKPKLNGYVLGKDLQRTKGKQSSLSVCSTTAIAA